MSRKITELKWIDALGDKFEIAIAEFRIFFVYLVAFAIVLTVDDLKKLVEAGTVKVREISLYKVHCLVYRNFE